MRQTEEEIEEKELISKINKWFNYTLSHQTTKQWLADAWECFNFYQGDQHTPEEEQELINRGQPVVTQNEIRPVVERIVGKYDQLQTRIVFSGRNTVPDANGVTDDQEGQLLTAYMLYMQQQSMYQFSESDVLMDGVISGVGWIEAYVTTDENFNNQVKLSYESCTNILKDPDSKAYDLSDCRYLFRLKWVDMDEAKAKFPQHKDYFNALPTQNIAMLSNIESLKNENFYDALSKKVRIVECWYRNYKNKKLAIYFDDFGNQTVQDASSWSSKKIAAESKKGAVITDKNETTIDMCVFSGSALIEHKINPLRINMFPFVPYFVKLKQNGAPQGIVTHIISPQREINKRRSKALHLLNTNQYVVQEGAIRNVDTFKAEMAKPDGVAEVRDINGIRDFRNIELAMSQLQLQAESKESISRITGISDESLNRGSQIRSGIGLQRKEVITDIITASIYKNMRRTKYLLGNLLLQLISNNITTKMAFEITDSIGQQKVYTITPEMIQKIKTGRYDIVIDEAPDTATLHDEEFMKMSELIQSFSLPPNISMSLLPMMISMSKFRNKQEILEILQRVNEPPPMIPNTSLTLTWDNLNSAERASFAQLMGMQELAQYEAQAGIDAAYMVKAQEGIAKQKIKTETEMAKNIKNPQEVQIDLAAKQANHMLNMQHLKDKYQVDMMHKIQKNALKAMGE